ncbi:MAG: hypothetical protein JJD96_05650 [Thermoleophilia bacterium]|nr:hypothetical protein [Thermoleophilia bacterium]
MQSSYFGIDLAQIIFGGAVLLLFIGFAVWGLQSLHKSDKSDERERMIHGRKGS